MLIRLKYFILLCLCSCLHIQVKGQIICNIQETQGMSGVNFFFNTLNKINNGIELGNVSSPSTGFYSVFKVYYSDTYPVGDPKKSNGWELTIKPTEEIQAIYGSPSNFVTLSDITVAAYIMIGGTTPTTINLFNLPLNPNAETLIINNNSTNKYNAELTVYLSYKCVALQGRTPNEYRTFFEIELKAVY